MKKTNKINVAGMSVTKLKEALSRARGTQKVKIINELTKRGQR